MIITHLLQQAPQSATPGPLFKRQESEQAAHDGGICIFHTSSGEKKSEAMVKMSFGLGAACLLLLVTGTVTVKGKMTVTMVDGHGIDLSIEGDALKAQRLCTMTQEQWCYIWSIIFLYWQNNLKLGLMLTLDQHCSYSKVDLLLGVLGSPRIEPSFNRAFEVCFSDKYWILVFFLYYTADLSL